MVKLKKIKAQLKEYSPTWFVGLMCMRTHVHSCACTCSLRGHYMLMESVSVTSYCGIHHLCLRYVCYRIYLVSMEYLVLLSVFIS